jgi:hypothetical protein
MLVLVSSEKKIRTSWIHSKRHAVGGDLALQSTFDFLPSTILSLRLWELVRRKNAIVIWYMALKMWLVDVECVSTWALTRKRLRSIWTNYAGSLRNRCNHVTTPYVLLRKVRYKVARLSVTLTLLLTHEIISQYLENNNRMKENICPISRKADNCAQFYVTSQSDGI